MVASIAIWLMSLLLISIGFLGAIYPLLPGAPLIFLGALLLAWWDDFTRLGTMPLCILGFFTVLSLVMDCVSSVLGARKVGASRPAVVGAFIGSLLGVFGGLIGLVVGPCIGAALGEWHAQRDVSRAAYVGVASSVAVVVGATLKIAISLAMVGTIVGGLFL